MLRPATPLTVLLLISFVLLLLSSISTPIIRGVPLARAANVNFGVFGWCKDGGTCSSPQVGWHTDIALGTSDDSNFNLPSSARHSLSSLLIVHPIAAFCNLIALALAVAAHFHSPSHSARYLLSLLILLLPTLLVTLLAFLVDILLFVPHLQWGGWIVLASTILITISGVVTCAMRRTLVSRKARKRRIAENAEMSGENFYARQAQQEPRMRPIPFVETETKTPLVNGSPGGDNLPPFTTYDANRRSEERASRQHLVNVPVSPVSPVEEGGRFYENRSRSNSRPRNPDYGAPLGASHLNEESRPPMPYPPRGGAAAAAYGPPRGRGYPPRGRGAPRGAYGPPRGGPYGYGRGGYSYRGRGGYPPSPGAHSDDMMAGGMVSRGAPPPGYPPEENASPERYVAPENYHGPLQLSDAAPGLYDTANPEFERPVSSRRPSTSHSEYRVYGSRPPSPMEGRRSPYGARARSPAESHRQVTPPPPMPPIPGDYVAGNTQGHGMAQPQGMHNQNVSAVQSSFDPVHHTRAAPDVYIPVRTDWTEERPTSTRPPQRPRAATGGSDYVEDVDPRFAETQIPTMPLPPQPHLQDEHIDRQIPRMLAPAHHAATTSTSMLHHDPNDPSPESSTNRLGLGHVGSYEDLPGARSPAESETSNFTSISQRGVNPDWRPGNGAGGEFGAFGPPRRQQQQRRQDMLFTGNPDFELPGAGLPSRPSRGGRGSYRGGVTGGMPPPPPPSHHLGPNGSGRVLPPSGLGVNGDGRYPGDVPPPGPRSGPVSVREV